MAQVAMDSKQRLALELWRALANDKVIDANDQRVPPSSRSGANADEVALAGPQKAKLDGEVAIAGSQKRDNKRFTTPVLRVLLLGQTYETIDWSLGGMMLKRYAGDLKDNMRAPLSFAHPDASSTYYSATARITRVDHPRRTLSFKFEKLAEGGFDFLSKLQLQQTKRRPEGS